MADDALPGSPACTWLDHRLPNRSVMTIPHRSRLRSGMVVTKRVRTIPAFRPKISVRQGPCVSAPGLCRESDL